MSLSRPAKVYHVPSRKYLAAQTCDLSGTGALLRVESPRRLVPGEMVEVLVQWSGRVLLNAGDLVKARVARVLPQAGYQLVGVEFEVAVGEVAAAA